MESIKVNSNKFACALKALKPILSTDVNNVVGLLYKVDVVNHYVKLTAMDRHRITSVTIIGEEVEGENANFSFLLDPKTPITASKQAKKQASVRDLTITYNEDVSTIAFKNFYDQSNINIAYEDASRYFKIAEVVRAYNGTPAEEVNVNPKYICDAMNVCVKMLGKLPASIKIGSAVQPIYIHGRSAFVEVEAIVLPIVK